MLEKRANYIREKTVVLIEKYSGMTPLDNSNSSVVFLSVKGYHYWNKLPPEGKQLQAKLLPKVDQFIELIRTLILNLPNGEQKKINGLLKTIRNSIEQEGQTWWKTVDEAVSKFHGAVDNLIIIFKNYYGESANNVITIPDTNALLHNPDIEHWQFEEIDKFTIILTPTILSELDKHKVNHRSENVRKTAGSVIRKIKEYRRRGSLHEGVAIVKNRVYLRSIAVEPNMSQSLSWFNADNSDDRFLATAIEVMRANLSCPVFIVTADINMQNKAEMAAIPFCEVPSQKHKKRRV
jgi:rRNA maturation endonuclease Nob1